MVQLAWMFYCRFPLWKLVRISSAHKPIHCKMSHVLSALTLLNDSYNAVDFFIRSDTPKCLPLRQHTVAKYNGNRLWQHSLLNFPLLLNITCSFIAKEASIKYKKSIKHCYFYSPLYYEHYKLLFTYFIRKKKSFLHYSNTYNVFLESISIYNVRSW